MKAPVPYNTTHTVVSQVRGKPQRRNVRRRDTAGWRRELTDIRTNGYAVAGRRPGRVYGSGEECHLIISNTAVE